MEGATTSDVPISMGSILSPLDIGIFASSIALSVLIGLYFANKNETMEDYMLGGRSQRLLPVAMSMMTSYVSGLTIIGNPAEFYYHGFGYTTVMVPQLLSVPFTALILLPVFHRLGNVSIYDYLEKRFHPVVKSLVSLCFMLQMTLYNAVVLFIPSLSLQTVLGISPGISIGVVGASCLLYSAFGGLKAIIWTDFFQAGLMYLSVICIAVGGVIEVGGLSKLIEINEANGRFDLNNYFSFDLNTRHTIYTILTGNLICNIFMNGSSQIQVQRALSLPTLRLAQWSMLLSGIFVAVITGSCSFLGLILTANYADCDPSSSGQVQKPDAMIFHYLTTHLLDVPGLRGLFVAGIFAATLSTLSSFQNSMSALMLEDFIKPCLNNYNRPLSGKWETLLSRVIALLFGLACIGLSFVVGKFSGLLQIALTLYGSFGTPVLSAFFLGMLTRFTNTVGFMCGMMSGFAFGVFVQVYQTFYLETLKPTMSLSMAGCSALSNATHLMIAPNSVQTSALLAESVSNNMEQFLSMSYLWLPVFVMIITCTIATVVSIATDGLNQEVDDDYLVAWMHSKKRSLERHNALFVAKKYHH